MMIHSALGRSPFEVLYGRKPHHFEFHAGSPTGHTELDEWLQNRVAMMPVIRQHME
jgi:hypothetical protein